MESEDRLRAPLHPMRRMAVLLFAAALSWPGAQAALPVPGAQDETYHNRAIPSAWRLSPFHDDGSVLVLYLAWEQPRLLFNLNSDGSTNSNFSLDAGIAGAVSETGARMAPHPDGWLLMCDTEPASNQLQLHRIKWDGSIDPNFQPSLWHKVTGPIALVCGGDGRIYLWTEAEPGDAGQRRLFRLNRDGSVDHDFPAGTVTSAADAHIVPLPDGHLLLAEFGYTYENDPVIGQVRRITREGKVDEGFTFQKPPNTTWEYIKASRSGEVALAGYAGTRWSANFLLGRLNTDGTLEAHPVLGCPPENMGVPHGILLLADVQDDGKVFLHFSYDSGVGGRAAAWRANHDGTIDFGYRGFGSGPAVGRVLEDGKIVGTHIVWSSQLTSTTLLRLQAGSLHSGDAPRFLNPSPRLSGRGADLLLSGPWRRTFTVQASPDLKAWLDFASGAFTNGVVRMTDPAPSQSGRRFYRAVSSTPPADSGPLRIDPEFALDSALAGLPMHRVFALPGGELFVMGTLGFSWHYRWDAPYSGIAKLHANGQIDRTFPIIQKRRWALAGAQPDGKPFVWTGNGLVRLRQTGEPDESFALASTWDPGAQAADGQYGGPKLGALAIQPDGRIVVGGNFLTLNGAPATNIARIHPDGSVDSSFVPDPRIIDSDGKRITPVSKIWLQPDGRFVVFGNGYQTGEPLLPENPLAVVRLHPNGSLDDTFAPFTESQSVTQLAGDSHGRILVLADQRLRRLHPDGRVDSSFGPFTGSISAILVLPDDSVLLCGSFSAINGIPRQGIARVTAQGQMDSYAPEVDRGTGPAVMDGQGRIYIPGAFGSWDGWARHQLVRLLLDQTPRVLTKEFKDDGALQ